MIAFVRQVYKLLFVHIIEGGPFSFVDDVFPNFSKRLTAKLEEIIHDSICTPGIQVVVCAYH